MGEIFMLMNIVETLVGWLWGMPLIVTILGVGVYLTIATGFFQFTNIKHIYRETLGKMFKKGEKEASEEGVLTPFEAISVAVGTTVGVGNVAGVATAIAVGGPGAVFWMWVSGIVGQVIKMAEIALAVHYREGDEKGDPYGGPTYYIKKGIGEEKNMKKLAKVFNFLFIIGFSLSFFIAMDNYTVSEAISSTFNINQIAVSVVYVIILYIFIGGGIPSLGKIANKVVPFMCLFYILSGLFVIFKNISLVPETFKAIFYGAFNGTAALGGFTGAAFAQVIQTGMSRAVFSNEAGWGTSAMIHSTSKTDHPVRQGVMGIFEVFIDTIIICSITALVVIISGQWTTGESGAALALSAFSTEIGSVGRLILTAGIFLFGITTSSGLYAQLEIVLRYIVGNESKNKDRILKAYKWLYPLPPFLLVVYSVLKGYPGTSVWLFADLTTALPIFINVITLLILSPKFFALLKDYKAKYMNKGNVDPNFKVYYHDNSKEKVS